MPLVQVQLPKNEAGFHHPVVQQRTEAIRPPRDAAFQGFGRTGEITHAHPQPPQHELQGHAPTLAVRTGGILVQVDHHATVQSLHGGARGFRCIQHLVGQHA